MEEKVKHIQARLRESLSKPLTRDVQFKDVPLITFEEIGGMPPGTETLIYDTIAELKRRGYRVANIKRSSVNTVCEHEKNIALPYMQAGSDATLLVIPDRMILAKQADGDALLDEMIELLGNDYDVIVGESFGFLPAPKFLMTDKPQEGFNLGLPNIIGYISEKDVGAAIPRYSPRDTEAIADKIVSNIIIPYLREKTGVTLSDSPK